MPPPSKHAMPPLQSLPSSVQGCFDLVTVAARAAPHLLLSPWSQPSRGCRGAAKRAEEQGAAMSYLLPLPAAGEPSARHSRSPPRSLRKPLGRSGSLSGGETFSLGKSRQRPGMTAETAVTPPGSTCTLWQACLPACQAVPGQGVTTLPLAAPPASPPSPCSGMEKTVLKGLTPASFCMLNLISWVSARQAGLRIRQGGGQTLAFECCLKGSQ